MNMTTYENAIKAGKKFRALEKKANGSVTETMRRAYMAYSAIVDKMSDVEKHFVVSQIKK